MSVPNITTLQGVSAQQITHDNHYLQQAFMRRWSDDGNSVWSYRTLVSHAHIREWELKPIKGLAFQNDLYTVFSGGQEADNFELWLQKEFEDPGLKAIDKIITQGFRLTRADWKATLRYVAAQDLRTPLSYLESMQRWREHLPSMLNRISEEAVRDIEQFRRAGVVPSTKSAPNPYSELVRVHIQHPSNAAAKHGGIQLSMKIGRKLWIANIRQKLLDNVDTICGQRWSVVEPHGDEEWPLTDQPVVRLNYDRSGHYDFGGGWGKEGTKIMMPISPRHLLYTRVGSKSPHRFILSQEQTRFIQQFMVERAYRWIFARRKLDWVVESRPRIIDQLQFNAEQKAWKEWHNEQLKIETS